MLPTLYSRHPQYILVTHTICYPHDIYPQTISDMMWGTLYMTWTPSIWCGLHMHPRHINLYDVGYIWYDVGYIVPTLYKLFPLHISVTHVICIWRGEHPPMFPTLYPTPYTHVIYWHMTWVYGVGNVFLWCGQHQYIAWDTYGVGNMVSKRVLLMHQVRRRHKDVYYVSGVGS